MNVSPDSTPAPDSDDSLGKSWPQYAPEPGHAAKKQRLIEQIAEEVSKQLSEIKPLKRGEEDRLTHRVGEIALECARAIDDVERRLREIDHADAARLLSTRVESLRTRIFEELARSLGQARDEHDGIYRLPLN